MAQTYLQNGCPIFAAVDSLNSYKGGFFFESPDLHGFGSHRIAMWASDHTIVPRTGQFIDRDGSLVPEHSWRKHQ
jgi:hypothetical protein